jgi:hypothetical protein
MKLFEGFLNNHGDNIIILHTWVLLLPLSLYAIVYPMYEFVHYLTVHNTLLLSYHLFFLQIAGLLGLRMFWLMRKGVKYYHEHYCKK